MPDRTNPAHRCRPETNTPAFTCYVADVLRAGETTPGSDNREDLVASKLGFVVRAALRIARCHHGADVDILDLIQEGDVALLQAVEEWLDCPSEVAQFHPFISQRVYRALRRYVADAGRENGRLWSLEEHWDELCQVETPGALELVDRLICREHQEVMGAMLDSLERNRKQVVALRFGFSDGRERTYKEIGEVLGFSAVRAAQLMESVRKILRHPSRAQKLRDVCQDLG